jgi:hypothetical protein
VRTLTGPSTARSNKLKRTLVLFAGGFVASAAILPLALSASTTPANAPHVMIVVMENESASGVMGNSQMPYTNSLASQYGSATHSYAFGHPSLPNYLALVSGGSQGVTSDEPPSSSGVFSVPTLATQLAGAGFTMKACAENMPSDPSNDSGEYAVRHFPWEYFANPPATADASQLTADLNSATPPDFVWFTPNLIDDQHDGTPQQADQWMSSFIPQVQATSWYQQGGTIVIEYDEGATSDTSGVNGGNGGNVPTIVVSQALKDAPQQYAGAVDTVGILHSVEDAYGLPSLGGSSADGTIDPMLNATAAAAAASPAPAPSPSPAPAPAPAPAPPVVAAPSPAPAPVHAASPAAPKPAPVHPSVPSPAKGVPSPVAVPTAAPAHAAAPAPSPSPAPAARVAPAATHWASRVAALSAPTPSLAASAGALPASSASGAAAARPGARTGTASSDRGPLTLADTNAAAHPSGSGVLLLVVSFVVGIVVFCLAATAWRRYGVVTRRGAHSRPRHGGDSVVPPPTPMPRSPAHRQPLPLSA